MAEFEEREKTISSLDFAEFLRDSIGILGIDGKTSKMVSRNVRQRYPYFEPKEAGDLTGDEITKKLSSGDFL